VMRDSRSLLRDPFPHHSLRITYYARAAIMALM
jgi:hypothetical protein